MPRGDVHRVRLPRAAGGHEQHGARYGVVVQTDDLLLSTVLLAPTSTRAQPATFRPRVTIRGERTRVLADQVRPVDLRRLGDQADRLTVDELQAVDEALVLVLGL
jgi:mRNA interferase MazF